MGGGAAHDIGRTAAVYGAVQYGYSKGRLRLSLTYPSGKQVAYGYDGLDRLTGATALSGSAAWGAGAGTTGYTYTAFGAPAGETRPNGVTTNYTYDAAHRLTGVANTSSGTLSTFTYTLGRIGNRTLMEETILVPSGSGSFPPAAQPVLAYVVLRPGERLLTDNPRHQLHSGKPKPQPLLAGTNTWPRKRPPISRINFY